MAIFNEILVGRFNKAMQRIFGIKASAPLRQLGGEVMPVTTIFRGAEDRYLEGWNRFAWSVQVGPNAAQTNGIRLRNPANSNLIAVIERLSIVSPNGGNVFLSAGDSNPDLETIAVFAPMPLDNRQGAALSHTSSLVASTSALSPVLQRIIFQTAGVTSGENSLIPDENVEIPMLPTRSLTVQQATVNTIIVANFLWRERYLEESERL